MAWCPKCRNEYVQGITICQNCNEPLVESLEEYDMALMEVKSSYQPEVIAGEIPYTDEELQEDPFPEDANSLTKSTPVYVKKEEKYKDTLSSAYTLLLVGFAGLIALFLVVTDIINLHLASPGKYVTYGGIAAMLIIFIVIGFSSLKSSKKLALEAESENQLTDDIFIWFRKNITLELIEIGLTEDMQEEEKYFKRIENMREIIQKAYGELNEDYLDKLSEDLYQEKF